MPVNPQDYNIKLLLGYPMSGRFVPPEWAITLQSMVWPMNTNYVIFPVKGAPREEARTSIIDKAIELGAEYVAMLDDDVVPPADALPVMLQQLEQHDQFDVIFAICPSKADNPECMVWKKESGGPFWKWKLGEVFEIAEAATACFMVRTSLFTKLEKPWFRDLVTLKEREEAGMPGLDLGDRRSGTMTDDIYFCRKAKKSGARMLAHGGLLCDHYDQKGKVFRMPKDSYPFWPNVPNIMDIRDAMKIFGWMSPEELAWLAQWAKVSKNIVEIGSFLGRSTKCLAQNTKGTVTAVDTWLGDSDTKASGQGISDTLPEGYLYDEFLKNMEDQENVIPMKMTSLEAAAQCAKEGKKFDMIFIDARHRYEDVKADILAWRPLLSPGGMLCGHDYDKRLKDEAIWKEVIQAVDELVPNVLMGPEKIWCAPVEHLAAVAK